MGFNEARPESPKKLNEEPDHLHGGTEPIITATRISKILLNILHPNINTRDWPQCRYKDQKGRRRREKQCQDPLTAENQSYV